MVEVLREHIKALEETATIRENSELLMDSLVNLLSKTIQYCHDNHIPIENENTLVLLLRQSRMLLQALQPSATHSATPKDNTRQGNTTKTLVATSFLVIF